MARAGWYFFLAMIVDADQSLVPRLPIIPDGPLLFDQPEPVAFEHTHQLGEPQSVFNLPPVYRRGIAGPALSLGAKMRFQSRDREKV
jgi:hypothetical protein